MSVVEKTVGDELLKRGAGEVFDCLVEDMRVRCVVIVDGGNGRSRVGIFIRNGRCGREPLVGGRENGAPGMRSSPARGEGNGEA